MHSVTILMGQLLGAAEAFLLQEYGDTRNSRPPATPSRAPDAREVRIVNRRLTRPRIQVLHHLQADQVRAEVIEKLCVGILQIVRASLHRARRSGIPVTKVPGLQRRGRSSPTPRLERLLEPTLAGSRRQAQ